MAEVSLVKLPADGCHSTSLMISQHWIVSGDGGLVPWGIHQVIAGANVDLILTKNNYWIEHVTFGLVYVIFFLGYFSGEFRALQLIVLLVFGAVD